MSAGITLTHQVPASAVSTATLADHSPTEVWGEIVSSQAFQSALVEAIRVSATGKRPVEFRDELHEMDLPGGFDELAMRIAKGDRNALFRFIRGLETLGSGHSTTEDVHAVVSLLDGGDRVPVVGLRLRSEFFGRRADQRREVCELIAGLARSCDVRLVGSGIEHRMLAQKHREDLPGVSEQCNTPQQDSPVSEVVETARAELGHDSREVRILRELTDDPAETLSYHAIESLFQVSASRVRQCISRLVGLSLVDTFDGTDGKSAELLETGSAFVDALDADIGRQAELGSCVSESGNSSIYCRVSPQPTREEGEAPQDRRRVGEAVNTEFLPRWRHAAVAGCATDGGIALVDHPQQPSDELRQPFWSYDDDADRLVVGAEYNNPLQWWVCIARALASYGTFDRVLTPDRLDGDAGALAGLLTDDLRILRDGRCLGYLKDADANGEDYGDALRTAADDLCKLTTKMSNSRGEEREQLRSVVLKEALGLAGTIVHLCDLAGVDVVREVRLPEFSRRFDESDREQLAKTLSTGASIQSSLGHFAAYRQLFEDRPEKRTAAMSPDVDAEDPHGRLIGSFVVVGDTASSFEKMLSEELRGPTEVHEDAPEFDVGIPVRPHVGRPAYAQAARETLAGKNLSPTREAVSIMYSLTGSPYDVAQALGRGLAADKKYEGRTIRVNECRVALDALRPGRIVPDAAPSVSKAVSALLTATEPLSMAALAERADVSTRSLRTHLPTLEALGLVSETADGYRLQLAFADEKGIVPESVTDPLMNATDLLFDTLPTVVGDVVYDFDHPIGAAFTADNPTDALLEHDPELAPWVHIAVALAGPNTDIESRIVRFGKRPMQTPLPAEVAA